MSTIACLGWGSLIWGPHTLPIQRYWVRYLVQEHDTLRLPQNDSNRSRWPLHPLWQDLKECVEGMQGFGVHKVIPEQTIYREKIARLSISVYGYYKQLVALKAVQTGQDGLPIEKTIEEAAKLIRDVHCPFTWNTEVKNRVTALRLGQW